MKSVPYIHVVHVIDWSSLKQLVANAFQYLIVEQLWLQLVLHHPGVVHQNQHLVMTAVNATLKSKSVTLHIKSFVMMDLSCQSAPVLSMGQSISMETN